MSQETSAKSRPKLKPFVEFLREKMSPEEWEWYSNWRPKRLSTESKDSKDD